MIDVESPEDNPKGFLNDWDLCKYKEDLDKPASQPAGRSVSVNDVLRRDDTDRVGLKGTWPFMSALSLKYPKKPCELADDLESFVYVLLYMAFRFHRHKMTPEVPDGTTPEELANINGKNEKLGNIVHSLFSENWACVDGYRGGGERKFVQIESKRVPLELAPNGEGPTPLSSLLRRLYDLLNRHYAAQNYKDLEKYAAEPLFPVKQVPPPPEHVADDSPPVRKPRHIVHEDDNIDFDALRRKAEEQGKPVSISPSNASNALDNHREIMEAFALVFKDEQREYRDLSCTEGDKLFDQFLGLQALVGAPPKKLSTKRELEDGGDGYAGGGSSIKRARINATATSEPDHTDDHSDEHMETIFEEDESQ